MATFVLVIMMLAAWFQGSIQAASQSLQTTADPAVRQRAVQALQSSPAVFIENRGQWADPSILFALPGGGVNVGVTTTGLRFQLFMPDAGVNGAQTRETPLNMPKPRPMRMMEFRTELVNAREVQPVGVDKASQVFRFTRGNDPQLRDGVAGWASVRYPAIYEGIDMIATGHKNNIKYEFHVAAGADWLQIALRYDGIEALKLRSDGALEIQPAAGWPALVDTAPYIYQEVAGRRETVAGRFRLIDAHTLGFEVTGAYDAAKPLVIDPELAWGTYVGGDFIDYAGGIALDQDNNIYITGYTMSQNWIPVGLDSTFGGMFDAYAVKIAPNGQLVWATYLGGDGIDAGYDIAVDASGNAYVTGITDSTPWFTGGFDTTLTGTGDSFVVKLSTAGVPVWGTYLGGNGDDAGAAIVIAPSGTILVGGDTDSTAAWCATGYDKTPNGGTDSFLAAISASGQQLLWCTFLGGSKEEMFGDLTVDSSGNIYIAGSTNSPAWLTGGYNTSYSSNYDAFAMKYNSEGIPQWGTYLGGTQNDNGYGAAVDGAGCVYITGSTSSQGWVSGGPNTTSAGMSEVFLAKLSSGGGHLWSTYLGGSSSDAGNKIVMAGPDALFLTGTTGSNDWIAGGFDTTYVSGTKVFVAKLTLDAQTLWSSYLGVDSETVAGIAVDSTGNPCLVGDTNNPDWLSGGYNTTYGGYTDTFVAKILDNDKCLTGSLTVKLTPPEAVTAGAKWRVLGTANWFDSDTTQSGVITGSQKIEFKTIAGWATPAQQSVTINKDKTTTATATYLPAGSLKVTINPPEAIASGAQWRRLNTTAWFDSAATEDNVASGTYTVEFKPLDGWARPGTSVKIAPGATTETSGTYTSVLSGMSWSTYLGVGDKGSYTTSDIWDLFVNDMTLDADGNILICGTTSSSGWVSGGYDTAYGGSTTDAYVAKISPNGQFLWSSYLGGSAVDEGGGIAVDSSGNVYVTGNTADGGWVSGTYNQTYNGGGADAFIVKLDGAGHHLWSGCLGGSGLDFGYGIAVDSSGYAYITGSTTSFNSQQHYYDCFVVRVAPTGQKGWMSYWGDSGDDLGRKIKVDKYGNLYVIGTTLSSQDNAIWFADGYNTTFNGGQSGNIADAFVLKLNYTGFTIWGTYLGGTSTDYGESIAVDSAGQYVYAVGATDSTGWVHNGYLTTKPTTTAFRTGFLVKMNASGQHVWSTYVGSGEARDVALDKGGHVIVAGSSSNSGWISGGYDTLMSGSNDAFVLKFPSSAGAPIWGTYLGGTAGDLGCGVGVDADDNIIVAGRTSSSSWVSGGFDTTWNSLSTDTFVAKLHEFGSLTVTIEPAEAAAAGAMWRPAGTTLWLGSGATLAKVATGKLTIEYKPGENWQPPVSLPVSIGSGSNTHTATFTFVKNAIPASDWIGY